MGLTYIEGEVRNAEHTRPGITFLVDSGASYTLLPAEVWRELKLQPKREVKVILADGTQLVRQVGECHIRLPHGEGNTPVILGEPGDEPLLGAVTLEELGFVLNPFNRTLQPLKVRL